MASNSNKNNPLANIEIIGEGFDDLGRRYIKLKVKGSKRNLPPYSMDDILKPERLYRELGDAGCKLFSHQIRNTLQDMLQNYKQRGKPSFSVVTRLGSFQEFYVRPEGIIGKPIIPVERVLSSLDNHMLSKYRCRGSIKDWQQKIGRLCTGNSRFMFAASLACTGPILAFVSGPRTGGFQISGKAESGKTALAMVAGSIWGCHGDSMRKDKGFAESWNTTNNKLEETAQAHSDAIFILDETNLSGSNDKERAVAVLSGAFRLSENMQKGRLNQTEIAAWRFYFLSTSNLTLDELADRGAVPIDDQHRGRLVDIGLPSGPSTHGIYENLHGFADGAALTDAVKARCRSVFGSPGYELICKLYKNKESRLSAKKFVAARRKHYIKLLRKKAASKGFKPLERATARFATVYAAGCLAVQYGVFTWGRNDLLQAVVSCQLSELVAPLTKTDKATDLGKKLIDYLVQNRRRLISLDGKKLSLKKHKFGSVPGYVHTHKEQGWFYLTSDQLKTIIGTSDAAVQLKKRLITDGMLASGTRGLVQRPIFRGKGNKGYRWVHAVRASFLADA